MLVNILLGVFTVIYALHNPIFIGPNEISGYPRMISVNSLSVKTQLPGERPNTIKRTDT